MYDGQIHFKWLKRGFWLIPSLSIAWIFVVMTAGYLPDELYPYIIWAHFNYFITRYIDPDLDQLSMTSADNRMVREIWILGIAFAGYWTLYAFILFAIAKTFGFAHPWLGAHRTWLSHSVPIGTIGRILFFNFPLICLGVAAENVNHIVSLNWDYTMSFVIPYIASQFVVWCIADSIHLKVDSGALK